jgi:peptidoglycan hydrolase-like protein with peptidoglycan-binding domain
MMLSVRGGPVGSPQVARHRRSAVTVAALMLALAACGSSSGTSKAKATTTTAPRVTTATTAAAIATTTTPASTLPATPTTAASTATTTGYTTEPTTGALKKGHSGNRVAAMQTKLKALGYDPGPADGKFGDKTEAAVKKFQTDKRLAVDGIAGNQTLGALDTACSGKC